MAEMKRFKTIGVVGSGQMGSGIAQLAATHGFDVWVLDTDQDALSRATKSISSSIQRLVSKGQLSQAVGVATKEDIDAGMKLGTNHPMGPLELADFIGLDVCVSILKVLHAGLGDNKYAPCPILVQYVDAGRLGRKRGIGVYDYRQMLGSVKPSSKL